MKNIQYLEIRQSFLKTSYFTVYFILNDHWEVKKKSVKQNQVVTLNSNLSVEDSFSISLKHMLIAFL